MTRVIRTSVLGQHAPWVYAFGIFGGSLKFSEEEIQELFGHEAAEDETPERLREYYFKSSTYDDVVTSLPIRILVGHKGIGKSALFQVAMNEDENVGRLTLVVKPDDVQGMGGGGQDFIQNVRLWKEGLIDLLSQKALTNLGGITNESERLSALRRFGGHFVEFLRSSLKDEVAYISLDPAKKLIAERFLATSEVSVYLDDLDRGWFGRKQDIARISALLSAIRDLARDNKGVRFRVALRSDVYFLVRTSDESTDKIEGSVVWQSWTQHEIFCLLVKRVNTYLDVPFEPDSLRLTKQSHLSSYLDPIFEPRFHGKGHWANAPTYRVLMSLIRKRPRDLVKLCSLAARDARRSGNTTIMTENLEKIFEDYSQGRVQDTINEYRSELPDIERLLFGMKPNKAERTTRAGYLYTNDALYKKIKNIEQSGQFFFTGRKPADTKDLAAFLYKINFLTARKDDNDLVIRKFFEESRYLQSRIAEFGFDWEIHPAYRWALQPDDLGRIFHDLKLTADQG